MDYKILEERPFYLNSADIAWVMETIEKMSLDEKIGQVFCVEIRAGEQEKIRKIVMDYKMGAVMCLPSSMREMYDLIACIQRESEVPLLIGGNLEEGADVIRGATNVANNLEIGAAGDVKFAEKMGEITAREAAAVGFNWAFAPVLDIGMNWRNPVIATRVFGADPEFVGNAGAGFVKNMQKYDMAATMKHFPGDGVDERDQHFSPSVNSLSCEEWDNTYGTVYRKSIEAGAMALMAGHILQPAWQKAVNPQLSDEELLPASLSKELLQGVLREHLGFNGMISTDSTTMTGFSQLIPRWKAIPAAVEAGCDMILFTRDMAEDVRFLKQGLERGILSRKRLDEAVMRVLGMKAALRLHEKKKENRFQSDYEEAEQIIGCTEFREVEKECAEKAITLVKNMEHLFPLSSEKQKRIYLYTYAEGRGFGNDRKEMADFLKQKLEKEGFLVTCHCDGGEIGTAKTYTEITETYDLILYAANLNSISRNTVCRLNWAPSMGEDAPGYLCEIPTVFLSFGNPYHLADVPRVKTYINAYKFKESIVDAVIDKMMGRSEFTGKNPVDPFCGFWDTRL